MGLFSPVFAETILTEETYSGKTIKDESGIVNKSGHTIKKIQGYTQIVGNFTNENGATIEVIQGNTNIARNLENSGTINTIGAKAHFNGLLNYNRIDKIESGSNKQYEDFSGVIVGRLINGDLSANAKNASIGEISGGAFGDAELFEQGFTYGTLPCTSSENCVRNAGTIDKISGGFFLELANVADSAGQTYSGTINTISGGTLVQVGNEGKIGTISGGTFQETTYFGTSTGKVALRNYGEIGEITGSANIASLAVGSGNTGISANGTGTGKVTTISSGTIDKLDLETEEGFEKASIDTISGGKIGTLNVGTEAAPSGGIIGSIEGTAEITTLNNRLDSEITSISGGTITTLNNAATIKGISGTAKIDTLTNSGTIGDAADTTKGISGGTITTLTNKDGGVITNISGGTFGDTVTSGGNQSTGLFNEVGGKIGTISGGTITQLTNKGTISEFSGGTVAGAGNNGMLYNSGTIEKISGTAKVENRFENQTGGVINEISGLDVNVFYNDGTIKKISDITTNKNYIFENRSGGVIDEIAGGTFSYGLTAEAGSTIGTISGGNFKAGAVRFYEGSKIGSITGGTYSQMNNYTTIDVISGVTLNGMFENNSQATIKEIKSGTFDGFSTTNYGIIETISDGTFTTNFRNGVSSFKPVATIKSITGGTFEKFQNQKGTVESISGGDFTKFTNYAGAKVTSISGGKFNDNNTTKGVFTPAITNKGEIGTISGNAAIDTLSNASGGVITTISGGTIGDTTDTTSTKGLFNEVGGKIGTISGGTITQLTNKGTISEFSGGTVAGAGNNGMLYNSGTIEKISGTAKVENRFENQTGGVINEIAGLNANVFYNDGEITKISNITMSGDFDNNPEKSGVSGNTGKIGEISGGTFKTLNHKGGEIGTISGGNFTTLRVEKAATLGSLTGGKFNQITYKGDGVIDVVKDVEVATFYNGFSSSDAATGGIKEVASGKFTWLFDSYKNLDLISGGEFNKFRNYGNVGEIKNGTFTEFLNNSGSVIESISGGDITEFTNKAGAKITSISGGKFNDNIYNGKTYPALANKGEIGTINGATIDTLENSGTIGDIVNASVTTLTNKSGGALTISGVLTGNLTNSGTVNFAMKTADTLGQLKGNLTNSGGTVNVDVKGATLAKEYNIVTGTVSGADASSFAIVSPNNKYLAATYSEDFRNVVINKSQAFNEFQAELGQSKGAIAEKLLTSGVDITSDTNAITETDSTIKQSYIATPQQLISNFKANSVNNTPLGQGFGAVFTPTASEYKPTANADLLRFDNGYVVNSLVNEPKMEFFANPFLGELRGNGVKGSLGGVSLGLGYLNEGYSLQGSFTYAYADSSQDLATQSTDTTAYMFQVGLLGQLFFADLVEIDINANYLLGKFKMSNIWLADSTLNSSSKFDNHQGNVGVAAGLRFGSEFSIKPFVGLQNYFESQGKYSVLGFESEKYSDYALNGVAGIEGRAKIGDLSFLYARVSGEFNFVESQKELFMVNKELNAELKYANETYKNSVSAGLGAQIFATDSVKLSIEGLYKYHDSGLNYYGGSLGVRVAF